MPRRLRVLSTFLLLLPLALLAGAAEDGSTATADLPESGQAFADLPMSAVIEQAIGIADIAFGKDPDGLSETLHFTGPVKVQKWPMEGYTRTVLPDGRVQISAEIVDQDKGMLLARCAESFQLKAPVTITVAPGYPWEKDPEIEGAPPDVQEQQNDADEAAKRAEVAEYRAPRPGDALAGLTVSQFRHRSEGTITQLAAGVDFPAEVRMKLYLNMHTPMGVLHNEEPLDLRSVIDGIPPVKVAASSEEQNEWHARNMPIRFVNDDGETVAWMTTRAHSACLVHPDDVTQTQVVADVKVQVDGHDETVRVQGMSEIHRYNDPDGSAQLEMVQLYLDGDSELLRGPVTLTAPNNGCRRVPIGRVSDAGLWFDLPLVLKTRQGLLRTSNNVRIASADASRFPDFGATLHGGSDHPLVDEDGGRVGNVDTVDLRMTGTFERGPLPGVLFRVPASR